MTRKMMVAFSAGVCRGDGFWSISVCSRTSSVFELMIACTRALADRAEFFVVFHVLSPLFRRRRVGFAVGPPSRPLLCGLEHLLMSLEEIGRAHV